MRAQGDGDNFDECAEDQSIAVMVIFRWLGKTDVGDVVWRKTPNAKRQTLLLRSERIDVKRAFHRAFLNHHHVRLDNSALLSKIEDST